MTTAKLGGIHKLRTQARWEYPNVNFCASAYDEKLVNKGGGWVKNLQNLVNVVYE